jgi:hypothetical protein
MHRERIVTSRGVVVPPEPRGHEEEVPPESVRRPATYTEGGGPTGEPWIEEPSSFTPEEVRALAERWIAIQGEFIESPRASVERANELLDEVIQRFMQALDEDRASFRLALEDGAGSTEELRMALRRCRSILDRLLAL